VVRKPFRGEKHPWETCTDWAEDFLFLFFCLFVAVVVVVVVVVVGANVETMAAEE
jgi:hypothetical protein